MVQIKNPGFISTLTQSAGVPGSKIIDATDHIHSGVIKTLNQMARGNFAIANAASSADMGFRTTQTDSGGKTQIVVTAGKIFRDGEYKSVATKTFLAGTTPSAFDVPTGGNAYFLMVADSASTPVLQMRGDKTVTDKVPDFTDGDTIIALIKMDASGTVDARYIQYLTTDKKANSLSIGYDNSDVYTETSSIVGASGGTTVTNSVGDFIVDNTDTNDQIVMRLGTDTSATGFEVRNNSDAVKLSVDGAGDAAISGDLTVTGADVVIGADADGTDRTVTFGHTTLKTIMGIDDSSDAFVVNTDDAFDATLNLNSFSVDANHDAIIGNDLNVMGDATITGNGLDFGNGATIVNTSSALLTITEATVAASAALTAATSVTAPAVSAGTTLTSNTTYVQTPLLAGRTSDAAGALAPAGPGELGIEQIQWLEVKAAAANCYHLPAAATLPQGTTITLKNVSAASAVIFPNYAAPGVVGPEQIDGNQVPATNPVSGITLAASQITLPGLRSVTLASYTDGGMGIADASLTFGGAGTFPGPGGWVIIGMY